MAFVPGTPFYPDGRGRDNVRLAYSRIEDEDIEEGAARLGRLIRLIRGRPGEVEPMTDSEEYFTLDAPADVGAGEGRYVDLGEVSPIGFVAGLEFRPVLGDRLLLSFVRYEPHTVAPMHAHEEEQITFVVEGERWTSSSTTREGPTPGTSRC